MSKLDRLFSACRKGDIQKISKLLEPSFWGTVSVNEKGPIGRTALMWAAEEGNVEVCKFLIEKGADMHLTDDLGKTAMFLAALNIRREVYTLFQTLCVTLQNIQDYTPLCYTLVFEKNIEAAKFIIEMGADINGTVDGHNIFYFLSFDCLHFEAYTQAAEFLIESGFDINALDYKGKPPLYYAMLDLARFQNSPVGKI